jgi:hypothetical protein
MNKVVSLSEWRTKAHVKIWNAVKALDWTLILGVATFVVLPQVTASSTFGGLLAVMFVACTTLAIGIGVTIERRFPYRNDSLSLGLISDGQLTEKSGLRKAA